MVQCLTLLLAMVMSLGLIGCAPQGPSAEQNKPTTVSLYTPEGIVKLAVNSSASSAAAGSGGANGFNEALHAEFLKAFYARVHFDETCPRIAQQRAQAAKDVECLYNTLKSQGDVTTVKAFIGKEATLDQAAADKMNAANKVCFG
jgi:hypothetical protein